MGPGTVPSRQRIGEDGRIVLRKELKTGNAAGFEVGYDEAMWQERIEGVWYDD